MLNAIRNVALGLFTFVLVFGPVSASAAIHPLPGLKFEESSPRELYAAIPLEMNDEVRRWTLVFATSYRDKFSGFLDRGRYLKSMIQEILVQQGVPAEMYYLAMIESGFQGFAISRARAVGIWQFMKPTAQRFGLRVNKDVDERLDVIRSTVAAARYLKTLHNEFGDWYLAMAAYNAGEGRVRRAIRESGEKDYWVLAREGFLPRETAEYVAKFQAGMTIAREPVKFGFPDRLMYDYPKLKLRSFKARTTLSRIARLTGVHPVTLQALNPHLLKRKIPGKGVYQVWIPET